ncbi:AAA family ATPase [Phyllobacterium lublinensis]|uniref:AAA family ATPase n=1 Tax=Phyllobacterium lublinensis TaxID=2875708 RepID=UPI001CC95996|nr:AAA family ATPase [Phyllobacterium sp. 2063]MBZ9654029.1 helicase RepA family protein [Phyllobacterium sp. 2063]
MTAHSGYNGKSGSGGSADSNHHTFREVGDPGFSEEDIRLPYDDVSLQELHKRINHNPTVGIMDNRVWQQNAQAKPSRFTIEMARDLVVTGATEYTVQDLATNRGLMIVYGAPGCTKTFNAVYLCACIADGRDYFGKKVKQGAVIYVAAEAGAGLRKRILATIKGCGFNRDLPIGLIIGAPNLGGKNNDVDALIAEIKRQAHLLGPWPIRAIVFDTAARVTPGSDENSASDAGTFVSNLGRMEEALDCLVVVIHHTGKDADRGMRGSSALHGAADVEWEVKSLGHIKTVTLVKNKDGEDGLTWSYSLGEITVFDPSENVGGNIEETSDLAPISSCFVHEETFPKHSEGAKAKSTLSGVQRIVLESFREAIINQGADMPTSANLPSGKGVNRCFVKEIAANRGVGSDSGSKSQAAQINRAMTDLQAKGYLGIWKEWVWSAQ